MINKYVWILTASISFSNQLFILISWLFYVSMGIYYMINTLIDLVPFH